jgi:tRNA-splicing endonuclease subunit Sen54
MAEASEDTLLTSPLAHSTSTSEDPEDESIPDFRFLTQKIPNRGVKDFEPHGTRLQLDVLEASRQAMHDVLKEERVSMPGQLARGVWDDSEGGVWCEKDSSWKWAIGVGKVRKRAGEMRLFLLPEEVLWLVERGSFDVRWSAPLGIGEFEGLQMSLQGCHAVCAKAGLILEEFTVYQYLRRAGYCVVRAEKNWNNVPEHSEVHGLMWKIWRALGLLPKLKTESVEEKGRRQVLGPLVKPGLYRDYGESVTNSIMGFTECSRIDILSDYIDTISLASGNTISTESLFGAGSVVAKDNFPRLQTKLIVQKVSARPARFLYKRRKCANVANSNRIGIRSIAITDTFLPIS